MRDLEWQWTTQVGCPQPDPAIGKGTHPMTRLLWPQCIPLGSVLGPRRRLILLEVLQLPKFEPLPYGCWPPWQLGGIFMKSIRAPASKPSHLSIPGFHLFRNIPLAMELPGKLQLGYWGEEPHLLSTYSVPGIMWCYWHSSFHWLPPITLRVRDILSASGLHEAKKIQGMGELLELRKWWWDHHSQSQWSKCTSPANLQQPHTHTHIHTHTYTHTHTHTHTHPGSPMVSKDTMFPILQARTYIYRDNGTHHPA